MISSNKPVNKSLRILADVNQTKDDQFTRTTQQSSPYNIKMTLDPLVKYVQNTAKTQKILLTLQVFQF